MVRATLVVAAESEVAGILERLPLAAEGHPRSGGDRSAAAANR